MAQREFDQSFGSSVAGSSHASSPEWDGIAELENPLPHWWLAGFLGCIALMLLYLWADLAAPLAHAAALQAAHHDHGALVLTRAGA